MTCSAFLLLKSDFPAIKDLCEALRWHTYTRRFHVDDLSSAHVYLRLPKGHSMKDIPAETLEDCAQLVKANSIQGNKVDNLSVVYTPVSNLRKTASMEVGQVCHQPGAIHRRYFKTQCH